MAQPARIVHIINSLEFGGAEAMLCNLVLRTDPKRFESHVVCLVDDLTMAAPLQKAGVPISVIGMRPGLPNPFALVRLIRLLRRIKPDLVHTWMDHSNLIGGVAARMATRAPVLWGIHHAMHLPGYTKRSTMWTVKACGKLSRRVPGRIVFCSEYGRTQYQTHGFGSDCSVTIPNGFDTERFQSDAAGRVSIRKEIGVDADTPLVGLVARYHPFKDHTTFIEAAGLVAQRMPSVRFLLVGGGVDPQNATIVEHLRKLNLTVRCHLMGGRHDLPAIYSALDLLVSSSISEAFPLVIGEAMSCGVACVVTDVGDSRLIVDETGETVPPSDPKAMAEAMERMLSVSAVERDKRGGEVRRQICEQFSLDAVTRMYEEEYARLIGDGPEKRV